MATDDALQDVVLRVMALMTTIDGDIDEDEVRRLRAIYRRVAGEDADEATIRRELGGGSAQQDVASYLEGVRDRLSETQRGKVLQAAFIVATADGFVLDEEDDLMATIAQALEIAPADYRRMLSQMMAPCDGTG